MVAQEVQEKGFEIRKHLPSDYFPRLFSRPMMVLSGLNLAERAGLFDQLLNAPLSLRINFQRITLDDEADPVGTNDAVFRVGFEPTSLFDPAVFSFDDIVRKMVENLIKKLLHTCIRLAC